MCVSRSVMSLVTPWAKTHQAPLSMEFSRQEYWSGLPFPSPGDLPNPRTESSSPTLQPDSLPAEPPEKPQSLEYRRSYPKLHGQALVAVFLLPHAREGYGPLGAQSHDHILFLTLKLVDPSLERIQSLDCCGIWSRKTHLGGHSRQWSTVYYARGSKGNQFPTRTLMFLRGPVLWPLLRDRLHVSNLSVVYD